MARFLSRIFYANFQIILGSMEQASQIKGPDGPLTDQLIKFGKFFSRWDETEDGRAVFREGGREGDAFYRDRWSHDKEVRSTTA